MFYFFQKGTSYLRCEIRIAGDSRSEVELVIVEPETGERVERFTSHDAMLVRWRELQEEFTHAGWRGPSGRE